ncbi:MAG: SDR family oxidoreductase [Chitinophagaceae bacterium]|nr:SDR family oxidoreductase [Anaerolineae bacterium]
MATDMTGKTILVTGATGNVGSAVVRAFAATGARVALVDSNADRTVQLLAELGGDTGHHLGFPADLSDPHAVDDLIKHVSDHFGPISALANTVGGYAAGQPAHEAGLDVWDKMMNLNARLTFILATKVAKHMLDHNVQGSINTIIARAALKGAANMAAYTASKAAVLRLVESMALELRDNGIRVNGISPSIIDTPPNRQAMPNADPNKWVKPIEVADLMVFLASDQASAITGAHIEINARS